MAKAEISQDVLNALGKRSDWTCECERPDCKHHFKGRCKRPLGTSWTAYRINAAGEDVLDNLEAVCGWCLRFR